MWVCVQNIEKKMTARHVYFWKDLCHREKKNAFLSAALRKENISEIHFSSDGVRSCLRVGSEIKNELFSHGGEQKKGIFFYYYM